jgi:hypothetical protein
MLTVKTCCVKMLCCSGSTACTEAYATLATLRAHCAMTPHSALTVAPLLAALNNIKYVTAHIAVLSIEVRSL